MGFYFSEVIIDRIKGDIHPGSAKDFAFCHFLSLLSLIHIRIYRPIILKPREKYSRTVEKMLSVKISRTRQPKRQSIPAAIKRSPRFFEERFFQKFMIPSIKFLSAQGM
jgi:hypothetical protein